MNIVVNGEAVEIAEGASIATLINAQGLSAARVAVELNGSIVARGTFDSTLLHDRDKVEIVHFVGGG